MNKSVMYDNIHNELPNTGEFTDMENSDLAKPSKMVQSNISDDENTPSDCNQTNTNIQDDECYLEKSEIAVDKHHDRSTKKDMQTLQSQQQRLQREAQFSIPYHKPKKYTLQEFLSRRTIIKPFEFIEEKRSSQDFGKSRNLKMSREELAIYSKLMEDRAKEASDFFKDENTENSNKSAGEGGEKNYSTLESRQNTTKNMQLNDNIEPKTSEANDSNICAKSASNVIITEIVELPKLDLKYVAKDFDLKNIINQSVLTKENTTFSLNTNAGVYDIFKASPTLKDDVDITFDLLLNEKEAPKAISSRANSLLERLMKTNPSHKPKNREILSPKYTSNALIDDAEASLNKKPGETYLKLKDNLKNIIIKKRREEIKKRQEEENAKNVLDDTDFDDEIDSDDSIELDVGLMSRSDENSESEGDYDSANEVESEIQKEGKVISFGQSQKTLAKSEEGEDEEVDIKRRIQFLSDDSDESQHHHSPQPISQVPATQLFNREEEADQLINLCSGTFETQPNVPMEDAIDNKIVSSSEDELLSSKKPRTKRLTKKVKKSKMKLGFSDDEADESDEADEIEVTDEDILVNEDDEIPATYVDYDSEENEITVELTKQDCAKQAETFFEKEAELSESEWGSADEDEKNLDQYDIELGDEDEFDKEEVRAQLEKIHARKMLDEDIRQVNKLQEILFEDEEDDSAKRQRKFRWKNFDTAFNLEINPNQFSDSKAEDVSDDENEHLWRKIRFEREQAIKNHSLNEISLEANTSVNTPKAGDIKNVTVLTMSKTRIDGAEENEKSPFLISKELIKVESAKARGSFLLRNKNALTKTICSVKGSSNDVNTSPEKIGIKTMNPSKFVFTTLTFEEHETLKRKADDINDGIDIKIIKRPKSEIRKSEYLIDKLL